MKVSQVVGFVFKKYRRICFILGLTLAFSIGFYFTMVWVNVAQQDRERQFILTKVSMVMNLFKCNDPEIQGAIMETFDPVLVAILIGIESEYRVNAVSPKGCRGLMQLSPDKLADWRDKQKNIQMGATYLQQLIMRFGSAELAIAAYNAGPDAVAKYGGVPPYRETLRYLEKAKLFNQMVEQTVCLEAGLFNPRQRQIKGRASL